MQLQVCIEVVETSQIGEVRRAALRIAERLRMSAVRRGDVAIVATELATNLVRYAQNGRVLLQPLAFPSGDCIELIAIDSGPGMTDIYRCMRDGFSTGGTSGTGLGAVRRLSDEFDAYSTPAQGTAVASRIHADGWGSQIHVRCAVGAVSLPAPHERVCGDTWRLTEKAGQVAVLVADGLGHGPEAAEAANRAGTVFAEDPFCECAEFFQRAHRALHGSRGAAVACAHIDDSGEVRYAGVGNIAGLLVGTGRSRGLPSDNGTVGVQMRSALHSTAYPWPEHGLLVMHSDGLIGRWTLDNYPGLRLRHPAVVAAVLYRDFVRGRDDVTVVVVALRTGSPTP
jgi:anti-sigma regulatory factor (Ser/Thr protein kinase)